ncbi:MAG: hypothetical protein WKG07_15490 [Hymenobacter sp.]
MRGVLSLAAALALPLALPSGEAFPQRNPILLLTFIVILVSLLVQGLTLRPLIGLAGPGARHPGRARGAATAHQPGPPAPWSTWAAPKPPARPRPKSYPGCSTATTNAWSACASAPTDPRTCRP